MLALTAAATSTIRIGSGAVQMGHRTALATVEEFGLDRRPVPRPPRSRPGPVRRAARRGRSRPWPAPRKSEHQDAERAADPAPVFPRAPAGLAAVPAAAGRCCSCPGAQSQDYTEQVGDILALLRGTYKSAEGVEAHVVPGEGAEVQVWILGSSGGESAEVAGANGLRFAANYHVSPATVIEAAEGYRAAFRPSADLDRPYVSVSADVVVAEDEATARELATGYGLWVRSIRSGEGAIQFPTPEQAREHAWTDADRELVADRVDTQFVGSPGQVADQLERLQRRHRRGRADHHHHHPRPRRPGPLLPAPGPGMGPARLPVTQLVPRHIPIRRSSTAPSLTRRPSCSYSLVTQVRRPRIALAVCDRELAVHVHVVVVDGGGHRHLVGRQPRRVVQRRPVVAFGQHVGGLAERAQHRVGVDHPRVDHLAGEQQRERSPSARRRAEPSNSALIRCADHRVADPWAYAPRAAARTAARRRS